MRIAHNISAMNTWRMNQANQGGMAKSTEKLSSGLRVNRAGDDAAGLAISEKMRGQIRGLNQASRNTQDAISLIQTAEGGMNEIHSLLQRGRELAVQAANGTLTTDDKQKLQDEVNQINEEINGIARRTEFNTINLLNVNAADEQQAIIDALKSGWLESSEDIITTYFGITGDGATMNVELIDSTGDDALAYVQGAYDPSGDDGRYVNQKLVIDIGDFTPVSYPNGGGSFISNDRIIAHEIVHAVMGRTMDLRDIETWFSEGVAEFIHGADERLAGDLSSTTVGTLTGMVGGAWGGTSRDYSAGYAAVRFLHQALIDSGQANGIRAVMDELVNLQGSAGVTDDLNQALINIGTVNYSNGGGSASFNDLASFYTAFQSATGGQHFVNNMDLGNSDTGAIGGADAGGYGGVRDTDPDDAVPDLSNSSEQPMTGFNLVWPTIDGGNAQKFVKVQVGANEGGKLKFDLMTANAATLGVSNADLVNEAEAAITKFDNAIKTVSAMRSNLGALQNRLEYIMKINDINAENTTASESRIRDADLAKEMMDFTKHNILNQASTAMLAQSNQNPQSVLQLLQSA